MSNDAEAQAAIDALNDHESTAVATVNEARPREPRSGGGGGGGGGGRSGGGGGTVAAAAMAVAEAAAMAAAVAVVAAAAVAAAAAAAAAAAVAIDSADKAQIEVSSRAEQPDSNDKSR